MKTARRTEIRILKVFISDFALGFDPGFPFRDGGDDGIVFVFQRRDLRLDFTGKFDDIRRCRFDFRHLAPAG